MFAINSLKNTRNLDERSGKRFKNVLNYNFCSTIFANLLLGIALNLTPLLLKRKYLHRIVLEKSKFKRVK